VAAAPTPKQRGVNKNTRSKGHAEPPAYLARETSDTKPELDQNGTTTSVTSHRRQPPIPSSSGQSNRAKEARVGPRQTVIRRVQAVINVKQEESEEEESVEPKEEAEEDEVITTSKRPRSLRRRNCVVEDEEYESQEEETGEARSRGRREPIDYHEDEDDEEDELMMSAPVRYQMCCQPDFLSTAVVRRATIIGLKQHKIVVRCTQPPLHPRKNAR
jgi:hypothetical protein